MSGSGGVSMARPARGENRFYVTPAMRKHQQLPQQQQQQQKAAAPAVPRAETVKRAAADSDQCGSSDSSTSNCSVSGRMGRERTSGSASTTTTSTPTNTNTNTNSTNLDRFLEYTTPVVSANLLAKTSIRGWRNNEVTQSPLQHPFFVLGDLWESFKEWSAYGAGVPVLLKGSETVVQYYVPYLSGIQLYIDPSRSSPRQRRPGEESDADSSRETSSDGDSDCGLETGANTGVMGPWNKQNFSDASIQGLTGPLIRSSRDSSSDECEISNPQGQLVFEYLEHASPFTREPLADKISALASQFPELRTYRSCDLSPSSWMSVAWYPIYRIPMGPTLQNLDACFLTFHSLATPFHSQNPDGILRGSGVREVHYGDLSSKLHLPTFGLASYKFQVSFWNPNGVYECQKVNSLLQAADNWLRRLEVNHPDYRFFVSHGSNWR